MMPGADNIYSKQLDAAKREIRLLQTQPDVNDCSTTWSMSKASLGTAPNATPRFNALSYVWGNTHASQPVRINSQDLRVTENLGQALRGLRNASIPEADDLPLWIDALCINQQDDQERNQQVAMMGDIYGRAERVLIWLGDGDIYSDWVFQRFRLPDFRQEVEQLATFKNQSSESVRARVIMIHNIEKRRWWTRAWVIQELLLGKNDPILVCGCYSVPWADFCFYQANLPWNRGASAGDSAHYWHDVFKDISQDPSAVVALDSDGGIPHGSKARAWNSLRKAIQVAGSLHFPFIAAAQFFKQNATEQRDYVYAFRGLLHPAEQAHIPVDYARPAMEIFHDAMVMFWLSPLDDVQARMIGGFSFHRQSVPDIPSWVPDLSAQKSEDLEGYDGSFLPPDTNRQWRGPLKPRISKDKMVLHLQGIMFDTVREHHEIRFLSETRPNIDELKATVIAATNALEKPIPSSSRLHKWNEARQPRDNLLRIVRTFAAPELRSSPEELRETTDMWHALLNSSNIATDAGSGPGTEGRVGKDPNLKRLYKTLYKRLNHRRIFITSAGFVGVGPKNLEVEDRIVFPFGMTSPWIVRPHEALYSTIKTFAIVGCAFVWDLSDFDKLESALGEGVLREGTVSIR
ncbi:hypothetical protein DL762_003029 [Monosporascus cannonballus]|uniref:Heterokaryon incompatibility domain-containing protein n=1 Tax=Monosporascus cannonballus TaxID=155416 RepID=A0ABY0HEB6_9PEZI|nr:hypothetical protein DL762_003029 [Monosporascus cannonballus]